MRSSRRPRPNVNTAVPPEISADMVMLPAEVDSASENQSTAANPSANTLPAVRVSMQRHLPRPTAGGWRINRAVLLLIGLLLVVAVVALINQRSALPSAVQTWWPLLLIAVAAVWLLAALIRHAPTGWLGSITLLGAGIGLLLQTAYGMVFGSVWLGVLLITIGAGTLLRGLLWGAR